MRKIIKICPNMHPPACPNARLLGAKMPARMPKRARGHPSMQIARLVARLLSLQRTSSFFFFFTLLHIRGIEMKALEGDFRLVEIALKIIRKYFSNISERQINFSKSRVVSKYYNFYVVHIILHNGIKEWNAQLRKHSEAPNNPTTISLQTNEPSNDFILVHGKPSNNQG